MRIIFFSNYFPPYARGGYEQWCEEVAIELRRRGHEVQVVTANEPGKDASSYQALPVHRVLNLEAQEGTWETASRFFFRRAKLEEETLTQVKRIIEAVKPDAALIWGMWNVPRSVPALIETLLPTRTAYYFCDFWPTLPSAYPAYWATASGRRLIRPFKRVVATFARRKLAEIPDSHLEFRVPVCVSHGALQRLLDGGIQVQHGKVLYGGIRAEEFQAIPLRAPLQNGKVLKLLYAGRLEPGKGVHAAIEAIALLSAEHRQHVQFTAVGSNEGDYVRMLQRKIKETGLEATVVLHGRVPRSEIPAIFAQYHALIFPSYWDALPRTVLEAMAAGLVVIGTTAGGTGEILEHGITGLTFPPQDASALADCLRTLLNSPEMIVSLAAAGRQKVGKQFTFDQMVNGIESLAQRLASG